MFCTECGKEIPDGSVFCTECGAQISGAAPPPAAPPGTTPPPAAPPGTTPPPVVPGPKPKSKKTMIGIIIGVVALLVVVAVVLVLVLVVFKGDDTAKAKDYMKKADGMLKAVEKKGSDISDSLSALGDEMSAGTIASSQDYNAKAGTIKSDISSAESDAEDAKREYEKIKGLKGVEDYKKYASLRIEEIDAGVELLKAEEELIDFTGEFLSSVEAGTTTDFTEYMNKAEEYTSNMMEIGKKLESASEEANNLKEDKNL
ncbi:MAG: zinc ribbon domain-containing protein [Actinobacteria bacterium]|nr:zinc ribbon domain-containing protein [Actinomycetota bacterium]